ncbi:MAG TPA: hypothetical protein VFQ06_07535, partial [Nitrospira sp.]|nr:hypothetical protein [Nitrospira sp.]
IITPRRLVARQSGEPSMTTVSSIRFGSIHPLTRKASRFPLLMTREYGVNERRDSGSPNLFVSNIVR